MANLLEMNGREIVSFRMSDNSIRDCWKTDDRLYLRIERRTGEMAYVDDVYIVRLNKEEKELERWNFRNVAGVTWKEAQR